MSAKIVDRDVLLGVLARHWPTVTLGEVIKASQNYTFHGVIHQQPADGNVGSTTRKVVVRATPDPEQRERIETEIMFLQFVACHPEGKELNVCIPVSPATQPPNENVSAAVTENGLVTVVFEYCPGTSPITDNRWMKDETLVRLWGSWFAKFHAVSRAFSSAKPAIAATVRRWDTLHDSVLANRAIEPVDIELATSEKSFGVLHGDLNCSNFFVVDGPPLVMHVFDWDQLQLGWFMYDLAQPIWGCVMLAAAGNFPTGDPLPDADPARFTDQIVDGYESVAGPGSVDRDLLQRMVDLRRDFYELFCRRSLERNDLPEGVMTDFVKFVVAFFDKEKKNK